VSVHKVDYLVIPAEALNRARFRAESVPLKAGQNWLKSLDSRFHGNDGKAIYKQTLISHKPLMTVCSCLPSFALYWMDHNELQNLQPKIDHNIDERFSKLIDEKIIP